MGQPAGTMLTVALLVLASCEVTTAPTEFARGEMEGQVWTASAYLDADQLCMDVHYPAGEANAGPTIGGCSSPPARGIGVAGFEHPSVVSFVYGSVPAAAVEVTVELADGRVLREPTRPGPNSLPDDLRLFVIPVDGPVRVARYEATTADGTVLVQELTAPIEAPPED